MKHWIAVTIFLFIATSLSPQVLASNWYRYRNDQDVLVIDDKVPPEFVHKGYEILNSSGRVVSRVPRALTAEELAVKQKQELDAESLIRQQEADKRLLSIFSRPEEAERARDRKIEALDVSINVTRSNIAKLRNDFNQAQSQAAERERAGQEVPRFLVENMDSLRRQIEKAEISIADKDKEKADIHKEYAKDIERLYYLQEQRTKASAGNEQGGTQ